MKKLPLILSTLLLSPCVHASVYKCVGEDGRTRYQAAACAGVILPIDETQPTVPPAPPAKPKPLLNQGTGDGHHTIRSAAQKNLFKSINPCPSTGDTRGPCPGYVVDHIKPLACGGADEPGNMQWQTVAEGKAKDAWERIGCQTAASSQHDRHSSPRPRRWQADSLEAILLRTP